MVTKQKINTGDTYKVRVTFVMPAINGCKCLYLVGKFSGWNESVYRMQCTEDGTWSFALELEPGHEYQYRYRTDNGVWYTDPVASKYVPDPDGCNNSVVLV